MLVLWHAHSPMIITIRHWSAGFNQPTLFLTAVVYHIFNFLLEINSASNPLNEKFSTLPDQWTWLFPLRRSAYFI